MFCVRDPRAHTGFDVFDVDSVVDPAISGRRNPRLPSRSKPVIATPSAARGKQSRGRRAPSVLMDCFVANAPRNDGCSGESDQEPQLLNPQVSSAQSLRAVPGIGGFDQCFEHAQGNEFDAIAKHELMAPRELLDSREKPQEELIMRLDRGAGALRIVRHRAHPPKNSTRGFAPGPQEVRRSRFKG